jgi:hypothetical protein
MNQSSDPAPRAPAQPEVHYKTSEIAQLWNVHQETVRRHFQNEPGVLRIGTSPKLHHAKGRKAYTPGHFTLRIPQHVFERVQDRLLVQSHNVQGAARRPPGTQADSSTARRVAS